MAGWFVSLTGSSLDHSETASKLQPTDACSNSGASKQSYSKSESTKLRHYLNHHSSLFPNNTFPSSYFRPLPPMFGNGQFVDLLKLYCDVTEKGDYDESSKNGLWGSLTEEHELGTGIGWPLKLIFFKYLDTIGKAYENLAGGKGLKGDSLCSSAVIGATLMELDTGFKCFVSDFAKETEEKKSEFHIVGMKKSELSFKDGRKEDNKLNNLNAETSEITATNAASSDLSDSEKPVTEVDTGLSEKVADSSVNSSISQKEDEDINILVSNNAEKVYSRKRKRASLSGILHWISNVAKNPTDPAIGKLPKISWWKNHRNDTCWMQVLAAREALFLKRSEVSSSEQFISQKRQKMHPSMFEDDMPRSHPKLSSGKILKAHASSGASYYSSPSDAESSPIPFVEGMEDQREKRLLRSYNVVDSICGKQAQKRIPIGRFFQAEIPEWTGMVTESSSKWLGTRVWPLEKKEHTLIERDPMGKGRVDSCGCEFPGSIECVLFHIGEKRKKVKLELGISFYQWKFDKMGEEIALSWTKKDEQKFKDVVKSNPPSVDLCFWDLLMKSFPTKSREDLVNYYFNVFLLRRRGYQNRHTPSDIDSDDDEAAHAIATSGSGSETAKCPVPTPSWQKKV